MNIFNSIIPDKLNKNTLISLVAISSTALIAAVTYHYSKKESFNGWFSNLNMFTTDADNIDHVSKITEDTEIDRTNNESHINLDQIDSKYNNIIIHDIQNIILQTANQDKSIVENNTTENKLIKDVINNHENDKNSKNTLTYNIHSLLIGCNYTGTPYQVSNCINNTNLIKNSIKESNHASLHFYEPIVLTDKTSNISKLLEETTAIYNKCSDNDTVFIYYSGYCDKGSDLDNDLLTISCDNNIAINDIINIFENENIKLILIIDGFYYEKLSNIFSKKKNYLIISSFVNEVNEIKSSTNFTAKLCNLVKDENIFNQSHEIWKDIQIIGNKSLLFRI
tara:strand:+ start:1138 stop:2148 length:1011 start_codon:yes stop_codon:yes gene_type:complete